MTEPSIRDRAAELELLELPLRSPDDINLEIFNQLVGDWEGNSVDDMKRFFVKQVVLDDETTLDIETIKVPGFIGIADALTVENPQGKRVSGHQDIVEFLNRYGLLICTYQWHKERYGLPVDTRHSLEPEILIETFIKNEGHHSGAIIPAQRFQKHELVHSYAAFNEPDAYHQGMYGNDGYVAVAQRLVFPDFITPQQARGYINSIICWMALLNPFVQFPSNYDGGDPTQIGDRTSLKNLLKNGLLASLGDNKAISFFKTNTNKCYCSEFIFICLNTPLYPFNQKGLTELLEDGERARQVLALQGQQNQRQENILSQQTSNPEFKTFNIFMPVVPEDLLPLDVLIIQHGESIEPKSLPFPPFDISQVIRRAFHTLLPRSQANHNLQLKVAQAQSRVLKFMEPALIQQLGLNGLPDTDPKVSAVHRFLDFASDYLKETPSLDVFEQKMDDLMKKADEMLVGEDDRTRFVPPRIYVDLGQNDGDTSLPRGWGFCLKTVGALISRRAIND